MFNTVAPGTSSQPYWDRILALANANPYVTIASNDLTGPPPGVSDGHWTLNLSPSFWNTGNAQADGQNMADWIGVLLTQPGSAHYPAIVMIDELRSDTKDRIYYCAQRMQSYWNYALPTMPLRWGVHLVSVDGISVGYPDYNTDPTPAIDAVMLANARIACEFYVPQKNYIDPGPPQRLVRGYCDQGTTLDERDAWLADLFIGSNSTHPTGRFQWLTQRAVHNSSTSVLTASFGVTDTQMNGNDPAWFLDRMFYVWVSLTPFASYLAPTNGGAGSWKWQDTAMPGNSTRDSAFEESWNWYCRDGKTTPRFTSVNCS
jgi:hypothetical protein